MSPRMLAKTGIITFIAGVYLYWGIPIWLRFFEVGPWGEGMVIRHVLYWFCVSLTGAGGLLFLRGLIALHSARRGSAQLIK
jgi:hypothetical protein